MVVLVADKLAAAIGTQVREAKSERPDKVLHEFHQSCHRLVLRRDEVDRLELDVVVEALGYEPVVPARRGRHGPHEVGADELKPLRNLDLARFVANMVFGTAVDLEIIARNQRVGEIDSHLGDVLRSLHSALVWMSEALVPDFGARIS